jgi:hypothetical protein
MGICCRNSRHFLGCRPYLRICGERRTKLAYADPNHAPDLTCFIQTPTPLCPTHVPAALCREWRVRMWHVRCTAHASLRFLQYATKCEHSCRFQP